jgi:cullin-associated NEDD8-dissociated protein 1
MDQDDENSPVAALQEIRPQLVKATLKQAGAKTVNARQQSFILLRELVEALEGGLDNEADAICNSSAAALRSSDSTTSSFTIAVLTFLNAFFNHHVGRSYASHLNELTKLVVRCMRDKQQRVNFEAFATASALAGSIRPLHRGSASPLRSGFDGPVKEIFQATTSVLGDNSVDGDVREKALITLGDLLLHEGDALSDRLSEALPLISARLDSENTAATAVEVAGQVAASPLCSGPAFNQWLLDILSRVIIYIRRNKSSLSKANEFTTIQSILSRLGGSLPEGVASDVIVELTPFLDQATALEIIANVLANQPATRATVDKHVLPHALAAIKTAGNAATIDALVEFYGAYVDGDIDSSTRLVPQLVLSVTNDKSLAGGSFGGTTAYSTTAKCIGAVVSHSERNLAGTLATFEKALQDPRASNADVYLALLCVGEIGRLNDLSVNTELLQRVLRFFKSENEEIRSAAAFAAGNMAVGAPDAYLPVLVNNINATKDQSERLLLLYSLKEVIMHSSTGQLEKLADFFWEPLFAKASQDDDGIRNIKAACIGKLTIADSARFVPQLQNMLSGDSQQRALLAASLRYTFIDTSAAYTEMIAPLVGDFLSLMNDAEPVVRRLAVAALNAAAQNKPSLISDKLNTLQPFLYQETEIKEELQRFVQMGPWKVLEDDGLENRKTAYETMYTLLATCFAKIDLPSFTDRVLAALRDVNEIKVLGLMLLLRLAELAPAIVEPHLDGVVEALKAIMKDLEVKEDTIKQDLQRKEEIQRSTMRTITPMFRMTSAAQAPAFHAYVASLLKSDQWKEFREYQG